MDALSTGSDETVLRARVTIAGHVTGVGFRPFVLVLAKRLGLSGWVRAEDGTVVVEVEGSGLRRFLFEVRRFAPPLARIDELDWTLRPPQGSHDFHILVDG